MCGLLASLVKGAKTASNIEELPIYIYCLNFIHTDTKLQTVIDWKPTKPSKSVDPGFYTNDSTQNNMSHLCSQVTTQMHHVAGGISVLNAKQNELWFRSALNALI